MADRKPILELSTLEPERPRIKIDGKAYELRNMNDFGVRDQHWLTSRGQRITGAMSQMDIGDDDEAALLEETLAEYLRRVVKGIDAKLLGRLNYPQRLMIVGLFFGSAVGTGPLQMPQDMTSTGANSSRGSNDSTAATPGGG